MKEFFSLFWLNLVVQKRNLIEYLKVITSYYSNTKFCLVDSSVLLSYLFRSPYVISKRFLRNKGEENVYAYGETPLTTLDFLVNECRITKQDTVFELGSGRGRTAFWLNAFVGCRVVGIEYVPEFVQKAEKIVKRFHLSNLEFHNEDFITADLSEATVIYLYGTCLENATIRHLIDKFEKLSVGTKIITVSYSLNDFTEKPLFEVMKLFPAEFTWGAADVYLHCRK